MNQGVPPKDSIVRAAGKLIGERGFDGVSVSDIAVACGMSKQALLYHFRTKDAIKDAVVDYLIAHANRSLLSLLSTVTGDPAERLEQTLDSLYGLFKAEPWAASVILRFMLDGDTESVKRMNDGTLPWAKFTAEAINRGGKPFRKLSDPSSTLEQVGMLVLVNFATLPQKGWIADTPKKTRDRRLKELLRIIRGLLFSDA